MKRITPWLTVVGATAFSLEIGCWFASRQIGLLHDGYSSLYPLLWRLQTVGTVGVVVLIFFLSWLLLLRRLVPAAPQSKVGWWWFAGQTPALLVLFGFAPGWALFGVILAQLIVFCVFMREGEPAQLARRWFPHVTALVVIALAVLFVAQIVSPLYLSSAMTNFIPPDDGGVAVTTGSYNAYIWSRFFSFSDFDYAAFGAAPQSPARAVSFVVPAIAFFAGLPGIDVETFIQTIAIVQFSCFVAGSFGFYLLCRFGFELRYGTSLLGGLLYVLGNHFYANGISNDPIAFFSAYAFLPFALLGMAVSLRRNSLIAAGWAGAALALPYHVMAPHPETAIEAILTFGLITFGLMVLPLSKSPFRQRVILVVICAVVALAGVAAYILPILSATLSNDMIVFGHIGEQGGATGPVISGTNESSMFLAGMLLLIVVLFAVGEAVRQWRKKRLQIGIWIAVAVIAAILVNISLGVSGPLWAMLHEHRLGALKLGGQRLMVYGYCFVLMIVAFGVDAFIGFVERIVRSGNVGMQTIAKILPIATYLAFFTLAFVGLVAPNLGLFRSGRTIDNPNGCSYQFSLSSRLANFPRLHQDPENISFIRNRLIAFEEKSIMIDSSSMHSAAESYRDILGKYGVASAVSLRADQIIPAAQSLAHIIDVQNFGSEECLYPPIVNASGAPVNSKRVMHYNNDGLYADLPSPFLRIRSATDNSGSTGALPQDSHLGIGAGLFLLDRSTYVDPRFMMSYPLLHALYLMPGNDYQKRGNYLGPMNWSMGADAVLAPAIRHLTDISGVDVVTIRADDSRKLSDRDGLEMISAWMPPALDPHYTVLLNHNSYGLAFLATRITPLTTATWAHAEKVVRDYFRGRVDIDTYRQTIDGLQAELATLKEPHAVLVEQIIGRSPPSGDGDPGQLKIRGIIGPRAAFGVDCQHSACLAGFNMAAVSGWRAFVDGHSVPIERINFAFLGAEVPNGHHEVLFLYAPTSAIIGEWITLITLLLLIAATLSNGLSARESYKVLTS